MLNRTIRYIGIVVLFLFIPIYGMADSINISQEKTISLLEHSQIYLDTKTYPIQEISKRNPFTPYHHPFINIGASRKHIWIKFNLQNPGSKTVKKSLVLTSALLEDIVLYTKESLAKPVCKGVIHSNKRHTTLFPCYTISLAPHTSKTYYLTISSRYNPVDFGLKIEDPERYRVEDGRQQFINILLIGMVLALMLYSFLLSFYTKDKSYLYYSFYLFALIYQQLTYLGLTQIYFPESFVILDIQVTIFKVTLLIVTAALYSMHFLKTESMPLFHKGYKGFIFIALAEMALLSIPGFFNLHITILTGTLFIVYNLIAGCMSYRAGNKQARLFILGFGIVFISYMLIILDAIGVTSIMQDFQNILTMSTALEALILSLAFADRYIILQKEKELADTRILTESKNRTKIIEEKVLKKTRELNSALETKELLLKEVHHRVKNNLQIILSIIRLQNDEIEDKTMNQKLINLENRINAISKTYDMLLINDDLEKIDMKAYIATLLSDIEYTIKQSDQEITINTDIDAMIPLRESVYLGLIINELVTNAYKYAFDDGRGTIAIALKQQGNSFVLTVQDDGKGFTLPQSPQTLGLKLIHTLVYGQLGGEMETVTNNHTKYTIRFNL